MTLCELFAGAGGASLGAHMAGLELVEAVEYDTPAAAALMAAINGGRIPHGRVRCMNVRDWTPPAADAWWASPPCQKWSSAGNGSGPDGWPMLLDALDRAEVSPRWLLCENVRGMLAPKSRPAFDEILAELGKRFDHVGWWLLDAASYGVPQHRKRVIIWAGSRPVEEPPRMYGPLLPMGVALGLACVQSDTRDCVADRSSNLPCRTVGTKGNLMVTLPDGTRRRLTVSECATLQGLPDGWPFQGTAEQRYRQVGNAVPPQLAAACWRAVLDAEVQA